MIRINEIKLPLNYKEEDLLKSVAKALSCDKKVIDRISLYKRAIDARKKSDVHFTVSVDVYVNSDENKIISRAKNAKATITQKYQYIQPMPKYIPHNSPVVVGAGPAGLFATLILARAGLKPILIERGKDVDARTQDVNNFWNNSVLDTTSNVQFGEGGAGTFSDGKLNTGTKDTRARFILEEFVANGAPQEILYNSKPHIGTDRLKTTVKNLRQKIISLGGIVLFETKLCDINISNGEICSICIQNRNGRQNIIADKVILAIGHSARDTFEVIYSKNIAICPKPFSVGVRIEHLQANINKAQYGDFANNQNIGAADYKLNIHTLDNRGVYTFCMCPGGSVVAAASEENTVVTNGMSEFARDKTNANSALLVSVDESNYGNTTPLDGVYFQRNIEKMAYISGGGDYNAPVQRVGDFLNNQKSNMFGEVLPSYKPNTNFARMEEFLPNFVTDSLRYAIREMDKRLTGFANYDAIMTGAETRSSSPIRILRGEDMQSVNLRGLFPCGEGAGYAGGIISAAVDGVKCAESLIKSYNI